MLKHTDAQYLTSLAPKATSQTLVCSPLGTEPFAAFQLWEAPKFLCFARFSIKLWIWRVSRLSSPSHVALDLNRLRKGARQGLVTMADADLEDVEVEPTINAASASLDTLRI
jgi:hypothetical protein